MSPTIPLFLSFLLFSSKLPPPIPGTSFCLFPSFGRLQVCNLFAAVRKRTVFSPFRNGPRLFFFSRCPFFLYTFLLRFLNSAPPENMKISLLSGQEGHFFFILPAPTTPLAFFFQSFFLLILSPPHLEWRTLTVTAIIRCYPRALDDCFFVHPRGSSASCV